MIAQASPFASPTALEVVAHTVFYVGVVALIGSGVAGRFVFRSAAFGVQRLTPLAWSMTAAGAGIITVVRAQGLASAGVFLSSPIGRAAVVRGAAVAAAYPLMLLTLRGADRRRRAAYAGVAAAGALAVLGHTLSSHAGVGGAPAIKIVSQTVHVIAVGAWLGGLAFLLAGIERDTGPEIGSAVARFSGIAGIGIAVVAVTGLFRSLNEIGGPLPLIETVYGRITLAKMNVLLLLAIFGAVNRYRHVPVASTTTSMLRRLGAAELVIAVVALGLTGVLAGTAPAREVYAARTEFPLRTPVVTRVEGLPTVFDVPLGDGRKAQVYFDPDQPGVTEAHVTLFDGAGRELDARSISVVFRRGARLLEEPRRFSKGHFVVGANVSEARVTMRVEIRVPGGERLRAEFTAQIGGR